MKRTWNTLLLMAMVMCLVVLPACGALQKFSQLGEAIGDITPLLKEVGATGKAVVASGKEIIENGKEIVSDLKQLDKEARVEADLDKSGSLDSVMEWLKYAGLMAGGGGAILGGKKVMQVQRRRREDEIVVAVKRAQNGG